MSAGPREADRQLDVREIEGEPFADIMTALDELAVDESLLLISSFEPEPLYGVLTQRGFAHETTNPDPDVWHVEIVHARG